MKWGPWVHVIAGVCLLTAPFALGYNVTSDGATIEAVVLGLVIGGLGLWAAVGAAVPAYVDYLLMLCGGWSIVAPFAVGYSNVELARNTDIAIGIIVACVSLFHAIYASPNVRRNVAA